MKKVLSTIVSAAMVLTMSPAAAIAAESSTADGTFHYVALGDSIASGYGLTEVESLTQDPALTLRTEINGVEDEIASAESGHNLIPLKAAYPYLFYQNTLLQKAADAGVEASVANIASTAFRAADVSKTALINSTDPYEYADEAALILDTFVEEGASGRLANYPAIYKKYLTEADLVSVQLGGNDMMMGAIGKMSALDNPILDSLQLSLELILFGYDEQKAILAGLNQLISSDITIDDVVEAVEFLDVDNLDAIGTQAEADAVEAVSGVLDTVDTVGKDDVEIALLDMYNPYGNSLDYGDDTDYFDTITSALIQTSIAKIGNEIGLSIFDSFQTSDAVEDAEEDSVITPEEAENIDEDMQSAAESIRKSMAALEVLGEKIGVSADDLVLMPYAQVFVSALQAGLNGEEAAEIADGVAAIQEAIALSLATIGDEMGYAVQYLLLGQTIDENILTFNADLQELADGRENVSLVDVYDIPNEYNSDPHPDAEGHAAIAELMGVQLNDLLDRLMPTKIKTSAVYRLYNSDTLEHLYTTDSNEYQYLGATGWVQEGVAWNSPTSGAGVYRLYNTETGIHHYTSDQNEVSYLSTLGTWSIDNDGNPLFYSADPDTTGATAVYRLYSASIDQHLLTMDANEYGVLGLSGWTQEGTAFYAFQ